MSDAPSAPAELSMRLRQIAAMLDDHPLGGAGVACVADAVAQLAVALTSMMGEEQPALDVRKPSDAEIQALCVALPFDEGAAAAVEIVAAFERGDCAPLDAYLERRHGRFNGHHRLRTHG